MSKAVNLVEMAGNQAPGGRGLCAFELNGRAENSGLLAGP